MFSLKAADQSIVESPDFKTWIQAENWESAGGDPVLGILLLEHCQICYIEMGTPKRRHATMTEMTESETTDSDLVGLGAAINEPEISLLILGQIFECLNPLGFTFCNERF